MGIRLFVDKLKLRLWRDVVRYSWGKRYYPFLYKSYWNFLFNKKCRAVDNTTLYYAARPNPGAGIGHQMANWNAGYWWANQFRLQFAHIPFTPKDWDDFLGFGEREMTVKDLKKKGYYVRKLPKFDENNEKDLELQRKIIRSYTGKKICFIAEQDQTYTQQFGIIPIIKEKFYNASARKEDHLIYNNNHLNIAIHVRRGDIMDDPESSVFKMRFISNSYFYNVLKQVIDRFKTDKDTHIYFFSQGTPDDYPEFNEFRNLHWCMDMSTQQSFLHMVYADILITSKSSFSYKPALLNRGIKVCPRDFWHGYPDNDDWILCDNDGFFIQKG